jgi:hypothetical protein
VYSLPYIYTSQPSARYPRHTSPEIGASHHHTDQLKCLRNTKACQGKLVLKEIKPCKLDVMIDEGHIVFEATNRHGSRAPNIRKDQP